MSNHEQAGDEEARGTRRYDGQETALRNLEVAKNLAVIVAAILEILKDIA